MYVLSSTLWFQALGKPLRAQDLFDL